jgi:septal ring factor EnvC (AmiA/AmiB activator)
VIAILLICLAIALHNIKWIPSQENETLENFINRHNAKMKIHRKTINEQEKIIGDQKIKIPQYKDKILELKINHNNLKHENEIMKKSKQNDESKKEKEEEQQFAEFAEIQKYYKLLSKLCEEANEKNISLLHLATSNGHQEIVHMLLNTFSAENKMH